MENMAAMEAANDIRFFWRGVKVEKGGSGSSFWSVVLVSRGGILEDEDGVVVPFMERAEGAVDGGKGWFSRRSGVVENETEVMSRLVEVRLWPVGGRDLRTEVPREAMFGEFNLLVV